MWDTLVVLPFGRLSKRNFFSGAAAILLAVFATLTLASQPTSAAPDATWNQQGQIVYGADTYAGPSGSASAPAVPDDAVESYISATNATAAKIIYFPKGTDPKTATSALYVEATVSGNTYTPKSSPRTISLAAQNAANAPPNNPTGSSSCEMDGIGWIVCPVSTAIAEGLDFLYGVISTFFKVEPLTTNRGSLYSMWNVFRNFANICFVMAFLVIIYAQMTGGVLNNYTIKKMLPRIIVSAILVNVSYWICAIAVDLSNILGVVIQDIFIGLRDSTGAANSEASNTATPTWVNLTAAVLAGSGAAIAGTAAVAIAAGTPTGLIFLLLGAILPAIFAVLVAIAVLAARQALITVFIILSPLAFVAYVLPNTDEWFTRWRKTFTTMLIMFPAFSVVFGGSQLAGKLIIQNTTSIVVVILGMAVQLVPLFITPLLIKLSSGIMGTVANMTNNRGKGLFDRTKNWADGRRGYEQSVGRRNRDQKAKDLGYIDGRRGQGGRARRAFSRANPMNMAYNQDYKRREREGMQKQNEATSEALFSRTAAGTRIYNAGRDAELEQHVGKGDNMKAYNHAMATGTDAKNYYRRAAHEHGHVTEGEGKVWEDKLNNEAEQVLQEKIESRRDLTKARTESIATAGLAELAKKHVEAKGAAGLRQTINSDGDLRQKAINTYDLEQRASTFQNTTQKDAEAVWETKSRGDGTVQQIRLNETQATDNATLAQNQWNSFIENIKAKGGDAPEVKLANANLAEAIRAQSQSVTIEADVQGAAKTQQQINLATELKNNEALRNYAGGVLGEAGATRVYAKARTELVTDYVQNVKNARSLLSEYTTNELIQLSQTGVDARTGKSYSDSSDALRIAAQQEILLNKGNNFAFQKEKDYVAQMGMVYDENSTQVDAAGDTVRYFSVDHDAEGNAIRKADGSFQTRAIVDASGNIDQSDIDRRRDIQQMFVDAVKSSPLKLANISGTDRTDMETGAFVTSNKQAIIRDSQSGKIKADKWATMDYDEMQRYVTLLRENGSDGMRQQVSPDRLAAIKTNIERALTDERLNVNLEDRQVEVLEMIQGYIDAGKKNMSDADKLAIEGRNSVVPRDYDYTKPYSYSDPKGPA